jgi:arylamine N-acetyltransferase
LNIVTLQSGEKYIVDVAFGGDCMTRPLPFEEDTITSNLGTQEVRYVYKAIEGTFGPQKWWQYQARNSKEQDWMTHYCFSETEFIASDFDLMNFWTSTYPTSFHTTDIFIVKFLSQDGEIKGKMMIHNGTVKENLGGRSKTIKECSTEQERVQTLSEMFGLRLTEDEQSAIQGRLTELKRLQLEL